MSKEKTLPKEKKYSTYSTEEASLYVSNVVKRIDAAIVKNSFKDLDDLTERIAVSYFVYYAFAESIGNTLSESKYCDCVKTLVKQNFADNNVHKREMNSIINSLINFSEASGQFARKLFLNGICELFVDQLLERNLTEERFENGLILQILHNVTRDLGTNLLYKLDKFCVKLGEVIERKEPNNPLFLHAILTLAYLMAGNNNIKDDNNMNLLNVGKSSVKELIEMVQNINTTDYRCKGFLVSAMLHGLRCLCTTSILQKFFIDMDGLEVLVRKCLRPQAEKGLLQTVTVAELEPGLDIVSQLLSNSEAAKQLNEPIRKEICSLLDSSSLLENSIPIRKHAAAIQYFLKPQQQTDFVQSAVAKNSAVDKKYKFDVFISYSWNNKQRIVLLRDRLKNLQLRVWFDEEQMRGNILDAMARGIEESRIILVGISKTYNISVNCKLEASYASDQKKTMIPILLERKYKPDGWLGIIKAQSMYYELTEIKNLENDLVKAIENELNVDSKKKCEDYDNNMSQSKELTAVKQTELTSKKKKRSVKSWSDEKVAKWVKEKKLGKLCDEITDGNTLSGMLSMWKTDRSTFLENIKKENELKTSEMARLVAAFESLL